MENLKSEYERLNPLFQALVDEVTFSTSTALKAANLKVASVTSRVKSLGSIRDKIERKNYDDPFHDITDFAGVRVVCLFTEEIQLVRKEIERLFDVDEVVDKTALLGTSLMGYAGCHFVVRLGDNHQGPRYDSISRLKCEIQVRTILQDAWAQIDHTLMYKSEESIPERERRELKSVSVLLEVAQGIFDRSSETRQQYSEEVAAKTDSPSEFIKQPIDRETLSALTKARYPDLPINERLQEMFLQQLDRNRYKMLGDLDAVLTAAKDAVDAYRKEAPEMFKSGTDYLTKSLGFVDDEFRRTHGYAKRTRDAFHTYHHLIKQPVG